MPGFHCPSPAHTAGTLSTALALLLGGAVADAETFEAKTAVLWRPYTQWKLQYESPQGNPFDVQATATFIHRESGARHTTGLFYMKNGTWAFRFTATRTGEWMIQTEGPGDLGGHSGRVTVEPNPDPAARGFLGHDASRWMWTGSQQVVAPQLVMYRNIEHLYGQPDKITEDLAIWLDRHGFNGLHVPSLAARWFDLDAVRYTDLDTEDPNPDLRTFETLEQLIVRTYDAGGMVHIWAWGDEQRRMTPVGLQGGINSPADRRLQRYIAARLGPLPGWSMGYGFDLWEWVDEDDLRQWHRYMHRQLGWSHMLGARSQKNRLTQLYEGLDYSSYEQHRPDYETYVRTIKARPAKPSFSEDRFRVRDPSPYPDKDYTLELTRRGLWHSTMAGGVANIWGYLVPAADEGGSQPYPNAGQIRTWATFFEQRFLPGMRPDNDLSKDAWVLREGSHRFVFYQEDTGSLAIDLSSMPEPQPAVAVDARRAYREIDLGILAPGHHTLEFGRLSDWAIAVGPFARPTFDE